MKRTGIGFALVAILGCGASELPTATTGDPLAGTWDFTTSLDTFYFETSAPDLPDCPPNNTGYPYCSHQRAETRASLAGTFVVPDKRETSPAGEELFVISGTAQGSFCSAYNGQAGCTAFEVKQLTYDFGIFVPEGPEAVIGLDQTTDSDAYRLEFTPGSISDGTITGRVSWMAYSGRRPPEHTGTFVAKKRK